MAKKNFSLVEASRITGLERTRIIGFIQREWICPTDENPEVLDEEDVARLQLIHELLEDFGANEEAVPVILHLLDQLYRLREQLRRLRE